MRAPRWARRARCRFSGLMRGADGHEWVTLPSNLNFQVCRRCDSVKQHRGGGHGK